jgi:D-alanyl-D-alanine carboxypeptidase
MVRCGCGCLIVLSLLTVGCGGGGDRVRDRSVRASGPRLTARVERELVAALREKVEDTSVPGASAAVVFGDGRVWSGSAGVAKLKPRRPMTPQTSVPFASITKIATAALAMRLVEQHRLGLEDPIIKWYPAWRGDRDASVRDLLGHTAGIGEPPDAFFGRFARGHAPTPRQYIAATPKPGARTTDVVYSNSGYMIAGIILARAAGEPVTSAMRSEIFDAPGGDGLALQPVERPRRPLAHSYWYPEGMLDPVDASDGSGLLPSRAEATMASTAGALAGDEASLARWAHALFDGRIVSQQSLHAMTRFHDGGGYWDAYGLGVARSIDGDHELWGHGGDGLGNATELWHLPRENVTLAVTWNDDLIGPEGGFFPALLHAAIGPQ